MTVPTWFGDAPQAELLADVPAAELAVLDDERMAGNLQVVSGRSSSRPNKSNPFKETTAVLFGDVDLQKRFGLLEEHPFHLV